MNTNVTMIQIFLDCQLDDYKFGSDAKWFTGEVVRDFRSCQWHCENKVECNYWTFEKTSKTCFMMRAHYWDLPLKYDDKWISGPKKCLNKLKVEEKEVNGSCKIKGLSFKTNTRQSFSRSRGDCQYKAQISGVEYYFQEGWVCYLLKNLPEIKSKNTAGYGGLSWCPISLGIFSLKKVKYVCWNQLPNTYISYI